MQITDQKSQEISIDVPLYQRSEPLLGDKIGRINIINEVL
jgi:hypothetical protein